MNDPTENPLPECDECAICNRTVHVPDGLEPTGLCDLCAQEQVVELRAEVGRLQALLNTPITADFLEGVFFEAPHQRERWGSEHDAGKQPEDWFWLIGYLAGKALHAAKTGNTDKALHHTISTAAALANWHAALSGADTAMRPGHCPEKFESTEPAA